MKDENTSTHEKVTYCPGNCLECPYLFRFDICGYETGTNLYHRNGGWDTW